MSIIQTPYLLTVLNALTGNVRPGRTTPVAGRITRECSAAITLADLQEFAQRAAGSRPSPATAILGSRSGAIPPSSSIEVSVRMWIDASNRLAKLQVAEPVYMVNVVGGASAGSTQFGPGYLSPGEVPSDYPYPPGLRPGDDPVQSVWQHNATGATTGKPDRPKSVNTLAQRR